MGYLPLTISTRYHWPMAVPSFFIPPESPTFQLFFLHRYSVKNPPSFFPNYKLMF
ncbi:hypothetical protein HanIR_Chr17g0865161 [Helianthus annuus]|nr:hypothetical protein HanIR_Chr17g0865161 [Helianthus annuus]